MVLTKMSKKKFIGSSLDAQNIEYAQNIDYLHK